MNKPLSGVEVTGLRIAGLTVDPLTPRIGAEVSGVDLSRPLDPETVAISIAKIRLRS